MRYMGIGLMAAAVTGTGFFAAERIGMRFEILQIFRRMVIQLQARILHSNDPLPEALIQVGSWFEQQQNGNRKEPGRMFLRIAGRAGAEYRKPFGEIWKEELLHMTGNVPLREEDVRSLLELGENLGYADRVMQERTITFYLERTEASMETMKKEMDTRMKLYRSLGAAAGLFLIVVLL